MNSIGRRTRVSPVVAGFLAGVVLVAVLALLTKINLDLAAPWAHTHTVTAQVADVDGISVSSDVRIAGRIVGQVTAVGATAGHATVTFHVDDADWPLPADTTASIRLATLLGQKYVQLAPGQSRQMMAENAVMGLGSTRPVVDFDQILNTFDKPTRDALTHLVQTVAGGVQGQEGTLQQLIPSLDTLSVHSTVPTTELVARNGEFNSILINLGITADQLNASSNDLAGLIDNTNSVTAALAADQGRALTGFITNTDALNTTTHNVLGSGSAAALGSGLRQLAGFANSLNTLLATLVPQTSSFTQPVPGAQPSDFVNGNNAIPSKSGIDLIYEIGQATSQGYGGANFGTAAAPNFQGNFFLRQFLQGYEDCSQRPKKLACKWGEYGPVIRRELNLAGISTDWPASATAAPATPVPAPTAAPGPTPSPSPSPSPSPTAVPTPTASPTPTAPASPSPSPSPSPSLSSTPSGSTQPANPLLATSPDAPTIGTVWDTLFGATP